jgi:hypothetical protein
MQCLHCYGYLLFFKYQVNNKTDKYIINILEYNQLQNIQEQHDINMIYCIFMVDIMKSLKIPKW